MANALYAKGKQYLLDNALDLKDGDIRAMLIDAAQYTVNIATNEFRSAIPSGAFSNATPTALANKTVTNGVFDADDLTIPGSNVVSQPISAIVLFLFTGNDNTEKLLAYIDTGVGGLPSVGVNGTDVTIRWDAAGILAI